MPVIHQMMALSKSLKSLPTWFNWSLRLGASALVAVLIPPVFFSIESRWLSYSYTKDQSIFEYFGFSTAIVLIINFVFEFTRQKKAADLRRLFLLGFSFVAFFQLLLFTERSFVGFDYTAYQNAAQALLNHQSPYATNPPYIYPPLVAQTLALTFRALRWSTYHLTSVVLTEDQLFHLVFYFYQCAQYLLTLLCFFLSYQFARKIRLSARTAILLVGTLFVLNVPLYRNFSLNQVNLWVLLSFLATLLYSQNWPILSGAMAAISAHIKIYPLIQLFPWILSKKWRAIAAVVGVGSIIAVLQIFVLGPQNIWSDFFNYFQSVEKGSALRNNSLYSLSFNLTSLFFNQGSSPFSIITTILWASLTAGAIGWIGFRFWQRMKNSSLMKDEKFIGNVIDSIALMFFVSPSVWDHHLVSAIPLAIWSIARSPKQRIWIVVTGVFLIFVLPTFDVFFFSYARLAGLIMLLINTAPSLQEKSDPAEIELFI